MLVRLAINLLILVTILLLAWSAFAIVRRVLGQLWHRVLALCTRLGARRSAGLVVAAEMAFVASGEATAGAVLGLLLLLGLWLGRPLVTQSESALRGYTTLRVAAWIGLLVAAAGAMLPLWTASALLQ